MWKSDVRCVEQFVTVAAVKESSHIYSCFTLSLTDVIVFTPRKVKMGLDSVRFACSCGASFTLPALQRHVEIKFWFISVVTTKRS